MEILKVSLSCTRRISMRGKKNLKKIIKEVIKSIQRGEVVVCPTDTVYGLLAIATNKKAVIKLFKIKRRPLKKPIPIFVKNIKAAKKLAYISKKQEEFLKKVWFTPHRNAVSGAGPGKVTVVLRAKLKKFPKGILSKDGKIGLRIPNYKFIKQLLLIINRPLTGTSANISGKAASTKIKKVVNQFKKRRLRPDLIIDAGNLKLSKPSTVVDLTGPKLKILRAGEIRKEKLIKIFQ